MIKNKKGKLDIDLTKFIMLIVVAIVLGLVGLSLFGAQLGLDFKVGSTFPFLVAGAAIILVIMFSVGGFKIEKHAALLALVSLGIMVFFIIKGVDLFPGLFAVTGTGGLASLKIPDIIIWAGLAVLVYFSYKKIAKK